ncbi:MAG: trehalose utilization protein ThuA [Ruminococcaceae bacterium]|nr:trehalose utilization protein ThuA [Oscillospiraceae bacterium]
MIKVTVWNEFIHEKTHADVQAMYPKAIHGTIRDFLKTNEDMEVRVSTMDDPEQGLSEELLNDTDVLIWWGHVAHHMITDETCQRVQDHVLRGMGLIVLHSAHMSKPFMRLLGTSGTLKWGEPDRERIWCCNPGHPIAQGIPEQFVLEPEEMYCEFFDIPQPDELVFISWFKGGEVFRSGCTFRRGNGKIFYFRPGHETNPSYHNENVQKVITNAVRWAYTPQRAKRLDAVYTPAFES